MLASQCITLENGLRVIFVPQPFLHSATVCLAVRCGSRHEDAAQWGLSHFLEHMVFRGSSRHADGRQLAHVFESAGGMLQAATWRDHTSFTASLHPKSLRSVLGALADMMIAPRFAGLAVERGIVEEELLAQLDEAGRDNDLSNISRSCIWRGSPMGRRIVGSLGSLRRFETEHVRAHHGQHYNAGNMVLCLAGRFDTQQAQALVTDLFGPMPAGQASAEGTAPRFDPIDNLSICERSSSQLGVQVSFEAPTDRDADFYAAALTASILDHGMSTRLPYALCERGGLVYELDSGLDCYNDCGIYDVELHVAPPLAAKALGTTFAVLSEIAALGVTQAELDSARQRHLHELEFRSDSTEETAQQYAVLHLFNPHYTVAAEIGQLSAVTRDDIARAARNLFTSARCHVTLQGPAARADVRQIEKLLER